ncbi:DUF2607 family protein [Shewanella halifaxensis]|uniref:DUF2607 family protein n=1 Tax=Shewanella halifaxensis TaxID=271098 RepID=UPI000D591F38|nr:DUF2607 family protein [Shewanella halifaxensis]
MLEKLALTRRCIALWLIAMMVLLSVASSVHGLTHLSKKLSHHSEACVLCIYKHQQHNALANAGFKFDIVRQGIITVVDVCVTSYDKPFSAFFNSRAPPLIA